MQHPLCRTCGERHVYGPCPQKVFPQLSEEAKAVLLRKEPKPVIDPPAKSAVSGKFDRTAYQREYMKRWRAKQK